MMRRVYCGSDECAHSDHVWENGLRFHYEPIMEYPTKEASEQDPWQIPMDFGDWKIDADLQTKPAQYKVKINQEGLTEDQSAKRMTILSEIIKLLEADGKQPTVAEIIMVCEWVMARGFRPAD